MELRSFCKYCSASEPVLSGIFESHKIRFTQPWGLNDPLEGTPAIRFRRADTNIQFQRAGITYPSEQWFYRIQIIEAAVNSFGMLSLTKIPDSFEMWALYGDGHRGFLVEFSEGFNEKRCMKGRNGDVYSVDPVQYVDDYSIDPDDHYEGKILRNEGLIRSLFLRKTTRWKHEKEFRIVRPLTDCNEYKSVVGHQTSFRDEGVHLFDLDPECIASVVFGVHMSPKAKRYVYDRAVVAGISLFQMCLLPALKDDEGHQGKLVLIPLERLGSPDEVLDAIPQRFSSLDGDPREDKIYKDIETLVELPYYERYPEEVEKFHEAMKGMR